ncbi:unnamed protein product, partial [Ascophyllum nodosum]
SLERRGYFGRNLRLVQTVRWSGTYMAPMGCLKGMVFGLTGELSRKQLETTIKSNGASVSAIIHKRVSFVVCTQGAVKDNTQKVRKANKHGIPLVSQDFLAECAKAKRVVDHTAFLIVAGPSATAAAPKSSEASTTTINSTSVFPTGQTSTVTSPPSSKTTDVETVGEAADGFVVDGGADVSGVGGQDVALEDIHPPRKKKRRRELVVQKPGALSEGELREGRRNCSAREGSET